MPPHEEHCEHCLQLYGESGADLHTWIDSPSMITGNHRNFRHAANTEIPKYYIDKYGEDLARNILLDHIYLDLLETKYKNKIQEKFDPGVRISVRVSTKTKNRLFKEAENKNITLSKLIREKLDETQ